MNLVLKFVRVGLRHLRCQKKSEEIVIVKQYLDTRIYVGLARVKLQLHSAIYCPDSFVLMFCYSANLKAIRYINEFE